MRLSPFAVLSTLGVIGAAWLLLAPGRSAKETAADAASASGQSDQRAGNGATPVIVELFTSEGCSSCPPADRLLARLEHTQPVPGAEIIALEQHVDYWNDLGWNDPFSSEEFSNRQTEHVRSLSASTAYTPQMIVDGKTEFVGSDEHDALAAIAKSARSPKAAIELEQREDSKASAGTIPLRIHLESLTGRSAHDTAEVVLAITENGLSSNPTRGENSGAQLAHRAVVRELRVIGHVDSSGSFSAEPDWKLSPDWNRANLRAVVFVQEWSSRRILAAATLPLSAS
jgi:hypothetical protein